MNLNVSNISNSIKVNQVKSENIKQKNIDNKPVEERKYASAPTALRSYISFKGNAKEITSATIVTSTKNDIPVAKTKDGGYMVEDKTKTELIYGIDATKYLNKIDKFKYDTQITFPAKATGKVIIDNKTIDVKPNSTVLINKGTDAKVVVEGGYPQVLVTKKEYTWYDKHSNNAETATLKNKFKELIGKNAHTYNGEFKSNLFSNDAEINDHLATKLIENNEVDKKDGGFFAFKNYPTWDYKKDVLKDKGFDNYELELIKPIYERVRQTKLDAKCTLKSDRYDLKDSTIQKLEDNGILYKNKKDKNTIYWKSNFESEEQLRKALDDKNITGREQRTVVKAWNEGNKTGYDVTGLKFINDNIAIYNLDDKVNNWSGEKSCWLTNSTALANNKKTPSIGTSIVQANTSEPTPMSKVRNGEHLHTHPGLNNKSQTELYVVTSGSAALTVVRDGVPQVKILREGELAIIPPNTPHCVNSVMGEYEQVVSQVPSAFQYGLSFKENMDMPQGYTDAQLEEMAREELLKSN